MAAERLDGKRIAKEIQGEIKTRVSEFVEQSGKTPVLAAVLVGNDPASQVYVRNKERACERVGIGSQLHRLSAETDTEQLLAFVDQLNDDPEVSGILVQLPLPEGVDTQRVLDAIRPDKDVDAFHPHNVGLISQGRPQFFALYSSRGCATAQTLRDQDVGQNKWRSWGVVISLGNRWR